MSSDYYGALAGEIADAGAGDLELGCGWATKWRCPTCLGCPECCECDTASLPNRNLEG